MPALVKSIEIGVDDRAELERIARSRTGQARMVERAQIVLHAAEGCSAAQIGRLLGCSENTVQKWRARYEKDGIAGLGDLPRSGKPLTYVGAGERLTPLRRLRFDPPVVVAEVSGVLVSLARLCSRDREKGCAGRGAVG